VLWLLMNLTCGSWLEQEIHSLSPWWLNKLYKKESYNDKVNRNKWNKKVCLASSQVYFWAPICSTALKMANMRLLTLTVFFNKSPRFLDGASLSKKCWHGTKNKNYINFFCSQQASLHDMMSVANCVTLFFFLLRPVLCMLEKSQDLLFSRFI